MRTPTAKASAFMLRYHRWPAALTLVMVFVLGAGVMRSHALASRASASSGKSSWSLEQLELAIAFSTADAQTWYFYGERLTQQGRYAHAAAAYKKSLELDPTNHDARFHCALALAQCPAGDELYAFLKDIVLTDPKLAVNIFDRPECGRVLTNARFLALAREARFQAID